MVLILNYFLKGIFVFLASVFLYTMLTHFSDVISQYQLSTTLMENVETRVKIDSFSNKVGGTTDELIAFSNNINKIVKNDSTTLYIDASRYDERKQELFDIVDYSNPLLCLKNSIRVNKNYLRIQKIKDINGKYVVDDQRDYDLYPVILVPSSQMNSFEVEKVRQSPDLKNYEIIEIQDNQLCFTYQPGYIKSIGGFIKNNCIIVDSLFDISNCLIEVNNKDLKEGFNSWCQKNNINADYINITSVKNDLEQYIGELIEQIIINSLELTIMIIGILLLIYQYIAYYIEKNRRKIFVLTIHGEPLWYKYQDYFKNQIILYAGVMALLLFTQYYNAAKYCIVMLFIDFTLAWIIIRVLDTQILDLERRGYYESC